MDMATTDLQNLSVDELIEICKERGLDSNDYLTQKEKPRAKSVLIRNIEKDKAYKANSSNNNMAEQTFMNEEIQEINEVIWTLEKNSDTNVNYKQIKDKLKCAIKSCHSLLYSSQSVVGTKAQNDIMKILTIRILQPQFENENSELYKKCKKLLDDDNITQEKYNKYMSYCCDLNKIRKSDNPLNEWKMFVLHFLKTIFKGIYSDEDSTFNFGKDEKTLMKLIEIVCVLEIDKDFIDAFSTSFGDIHEAFREYSGGKGAKELGQFFTPRHLIHAVLHGCGLNDIIKGYENPSIYDCCMGTGGLLTRAYSNGNILPANIYGCETEKDTIKFGQCSILLATGEFNSNIQLCNSLCDNRFIGTKKFDVIFTNPPFGTSMKYKDLEKRFNDNKESVDNPINIGVDFKDVYPIDTNNGACLFTQHCMYMLEDNGMCAIVLPDGELFTGNTFKKFRKYMCEKVNILKIINVSGKAFEHTAIKTAVIIFKKNGITENIEFMEVPDDCNSAKSLMIVHVNNIKNNNYNLTYNAYITKEDTEYGEGVVVKTLGEVCKFLPKSKRNAKYGNKEGLYPFFKSSTKVDSYIDEPDYEEESLIIGDGGEPNINYGIKFSTSDHCYILQNKNKLLLNIKYAYYYLYHNLDMMKQLYTGVAIKNISKTNIEGIKIPIPSLERQQEIVEECEQITKSIDTIKLRREQLKCDGTLFKKYYKHNELNEIYKNSEVKTLGEVCNFQNGKGIKKDTLIEGEYPVIGGGQKPMGFHNKYNTSENTILCSSSGAYAGFFSKYDKKVWASDCFSIIPKDTSVNNTYLYYILKSFQEKIYKLHTGVAQPHIYSKDIDKLKIPIPTLENQEKVIAYYEQMNDEYKKHILDKIDEYNKELEMYKELCSNMFCV